MSDKKPIEIDLTTVERKSDRILGQLWKFSDKTYSFREKNGRGLDSNFAAYSRIMASLKTEREIVIWAKPEPPIVAQTHPPEYRYLATEVRIPNLRFSVWAPPRFNPQKQLILIKTHRVVIEWPMEFWDHGDELARGSTLAINFANGRLFAFKRPSADLDFANFQRTSD